MKRLLLLLFPALFLVGCKDGPTKGDPDAETPPDVTHVRRIGAAGGELVSEDGQVTVRVPAGALSEDVTLEIHRVPAASWPEEANEPQYRPVSSTVYQLLPSGQTFDEPVHIIHRVPPASLSTGNSEPGRFPAAQHVSRTQSGSLERHATTTVHGRSSAAAVGSIRHFSYHWLTLPEEETIGVDPMMNTEEAHEIFVGSELGMEGFEIRSTYEITSEIEIQINVHTLAGDPIVPIPYFGEANPVQDDVRFLAAYAAATGDESARSISILGDPMMYSGLSPDSPFYTYSAPNVRCVDYGSASAFFEVVVKESGDEGLERSIFFEIEIECIGQPIDEIRYPLPAELTARVATPLPPGTADTYAPFGLEPNHMLVALFSDELSDVAPAMAIVNVSAWTNSEWDDPRPPASDFAFVSPPLLTSPPAQPPLVYDAAVRKMASSTDPVVNFVLATSQGVMSPATREEAPDRVEGEQSGVSGWIVSSDSLNNLKFLAEA